MPGLESRTGGWLVSPAAGGEKTFVPCFTLPKYGFQDINMSLVNEVSDVLTMFSRRIQHLYRQMRIIKLLTSKYSRQNPMIHQTLKICLSPSIFLSRKNQKKSQPPEIISLCSKVQKLDLRNHTNHLLGA